MLADTTKAPKKETNSPCSDRLYGHRPPPRHGKPVDLSLEFFPPSSADAESRLWQSIDQLKRLKPRLVTVTYGADGSTRAKTYSTVKRIINETSLTVAPHITCVSASKGELLELAQQYWNDGIRHLVALRGDPPKSPSVALPRTQRYTYCSEFVADLRRIGDFDIAVAAYPETHPEALSPASDLENLRRKLDAGATRAITQFFFDNTHFLRFRDHCALFNMEQALIPGILPVQNFKQVQRFAGLCGTHVPAWLEHRFQGLDNDPETRKLLAAAVAIEQVNDLSSHGVSRFHLYTLNRANVSYAIGHALRARTDATSLRGAAA